MKPILFNTDTVRAILDERKTVTRRVIKQSALDRFVIDDDGELIGSLYQNDKECIVYPSVDDCPYQPSDILYVRETWAEWHKRFAYKASSFGSEKYIEKDGTESVIKWRPSIHMPREAARIFLRVTEVRVERLQDITATQIEREGIRLYDDICRDESWHPSFYDPDSGGSPSLIIGISRMWDSIIKPDDRALYGWDANPWVWVIEFQRISREEAEQNAKVKN